MLLWMVFTVLAVGLAMNCRMAASRAVATGGAVSRSPNCATFFWLAMSWADLICTLLYVGTLRPLATPTFHLSSARYAASAWPVPMYSSTFLAASLFFALAGRMKPSIGASM